MLIDIAQNAVYGIVSGGILLLASIGFSMVYRIEGFLNISHAELLTVGAYIAVLFNVFLHLNLVLASILAIIITALIGLLIAKKLFSPMRQFGPLILLITSVGVAFAMHGITEFVAGPNIRTYNVKIPMAIKIGGYPFVSSNEIIIIVIAICSALFLHLILTRTKLGTAFRAMASNFDLARVKGIDTDRMSTYVWLYASGMAALAGVLLGLVTRVDTDLGWDQILIIMSATILGGLGKIYGVMIGALVIGLAMDLGILVLPSSYRPAIALGIIIVILLVKPSGIFGGEY